MNINILKQEKQPLLSRTEISAKVEFKGPTPSKEEIKKNIAFKLKKKEELTVIKYIYNEFGLQEAEVAAFIYDDKKVMSILEKETKKKGKKPEAKSSAEQPTEKPEAKSPAEQPTEKPEAKSPAEQLTEKQK